MAPPRKKNGSMDWEGIIQSSENPIGMRAQTADSTVTNMDALGPQEWKWGLNADGDRWNKGFSAEPDAYAVPATPAPRRRKR